MDVKEIINLLKNMKNNETLVIDYKGISKVLIDNE